MLFGFLVPGFFETTVGMKDDRTFIERRSGSSCTDGSQDIRMRNAITPPAISISHSAGFSENSRRAFTPSELIAAPASN
jgi:hypothetical protein